MKIFMCDNRLGGLLGFRADVIQHFVAAGHQVTLLAPKATTEWDKIGEHIEGVRIICIPMDPNGLNPLKDIKLFYFLLKLYRRERPDIVFNYTIKPNIYSCMAGKMVGARVVDMLAGLGYIFNGKDFVRSMVRRFYRYALSKADKVLTLNEGNRQFLLSGKFVDPQKLVLLKGGEGINLDEYPYVPVSYKSEIRFLVISRVLIDKGYREFVKASKRVRSLYDNVHLEWLGPTDVDSPMGISIATLEKDVSENTIKYLGVTHDVKKYLNRDGVVVVLPSYHEGMSRSLMEACSTGRPVITSDIPGCREMVDDGINGYLVPKGDADALAEAMLRYIRLLPEGKERMAYASRSKAEECFDVRFNLLTYDELLAG